MKNTIADALIEKGLMKGLKEGREEGREEGRGEGLIQGRKEALLHQIGIKFGRVPRKVERRIMATDDIALLERWLAGVLSADSIREIGL